MRLCRLLELLQQSGMVSRRLERSLQTVVPVLVADQIARFGQQFADNDRGPVLGLDPLLHLVRRMAQALFHHVAAELLL